MDLFILTSKLEEAIMPLKASGKILDIYVHCIMNLVMMPRYELLSTLHILGKFMCIKNTNSDFKKTVKNTTHQSKLWILSSDNTRFTTIWNSNEKVVPEEIEKIYIDTFGSSVNELVEEYIDEDNMEQFVSSIKEEQKKYLTNWLLPSNKEKNKGIRDMHEMHKEQIMNDDKETELNKVRLNYNSKKLFTDKKIEDAQMTEEYRTLEGNMKMTQEIIDRKYINGVDEIKKNDKERFDKIFLAYQSHGHPVSQETKTIICRLWYGEYYSKNDYGSDDILNIVKKHDLRFKIKNDHINSELNKIILQSYIVGLYLGSDILLIYTIVNHVSRMTPGLNHVVAPSMIHNGSVPKIEVQEVLNPIITHLPLDDKQEIIRRNWNKLRSPSINISKLVQRIEDTQMDSSLKFSIVVILEDLLGDNNSFTISDFARKAHALLIKYKSQKLDITVKQLTRLLYYGENQEEEEEEEEFEED